MRTTCTGPVRDPDCGAYECPYGYTPHEGEPWEDRCRRCRAAADQYADWAADDRAMEYVNDVKGELHASCVGAD